MTHVKNRTEILEDLRSMKDELAERYHVRIVGLFGSYARKEQGEASDIDLLVEFSPGADLFDFIGLSQFLEERFGLRVDVVPQTALRPEIREQVIRDLIYA